MTKPELIEKINLYGRDIYSFCVHLTKNRMEADELYQDTWLEIVEHLDRVDALPERLRILMCLGIGAP